jgi:hypothetical protein
MRVGEKTPEGSTSIVWLPADKVTVDIPQIATVASSLATISPAVADTAVG